MSHKLKFENERRKDENKEQLVYGTLTVVMLLCGLGAFILEIANG